jgi:Glycosyl transferases group 1
VKRADLFDAVIERVRPEVGDVVGVSLEQTPRSKVPLFMNAADMTLMTSESEGSPVTIKESLACLTPVVSVRVGDVHELIGSLPGCTVADRDPEFLALGHRGICRSPISHTPSASCCYTLSRVAERIAACLRKHRYQGQPIVGDRVERGASQSSLGLLPRVSVDPAYTRQARPHEGAGDTRKRRARSNERTP